MCVVKCLRRPHANCVSRGVLVVGVGAIVNQSAALPVSCSLHAQLGSLIDCNRVSAVFLLRVCSCVCVSPRVLITALPIACCDVRAGPVRCIETEHSDARPARRLGVGLCATRRRT